MSDNLSNTIDQLSTMPMNIESSQHLAQSSSISSVPLLSHAPSALNSQLNNLNSLVSNCSDVTFNNMTVTSGVAVPTLTSHSNIISYPPSLPCHPNLSNTPLAYQAFIPHPGFVGHPNLNPYSAITSQATSMAPSQQSRLTGLSLLSQPQPHTALLQLASSSPASHDGSNAATLAHASNVAHSQNLANQAQQQQPPQNLQQIPSYMQPVQQSQQPQQQQQQSEPSICSNNLTKTNLSPGYQQQQQHQQPQSSQQLQQQQNPVPHNLSLMNKTALEMCAAASVSSPSSIDGGTAAAAPQLSSSRPNAAVKRKRNAGRSNKTTTSNECFICSTHIDSSLMESTIKLSINMPHSRAPLLVLLSDVLGYNLAPMSSLHSKVVCRACYHLLEVIDETQLTQTKNKADVRRRFQLTMNTKGLVYSRIERDRLGKLLCRRCGNAAAAAAARFLASSSIPPRRSRNSNRGKKKSPDNSTADVPKTEESEVPDLAKPGSSERRTSESENSEAESEPVMMLEVEPDIHVEDLKSYKCDDAKQNTSAEEGSSFNTPVSCSDKSHTSLCAIDSDEARDGLLSYSSDDASLLDDSCADKREDETKDSCSNGSHSNTENDLNNSANESSNDALVRIYDNDPAIFTGEERLKVGVMRRESVSVDTKYQCNYCAFACSSAVGLKMHVRVGHMPVLVYDTLKHLQNRNPMPYGMQYASMAAHSLDNVGSKLRMGVRLQNVASDLATLNEKPFVCLFCDCAYKLQSSLLSHFRDQHSPYKPFQCSMCSQAFRRNIELVRHNIYRCPARTKNGKKCKKW